MEGTTAGASKGAGYVSLLVVLYGAAFLAGFNENLMNMGLMSIMGEYGVGSVTAQWLVTGYMIASTVVVMCMAYLYRRFQLRTLFFASAALCMAGSALGLVAGSFPVLLLARVVQAVGAGGFIPMMMNTVLAVTPKNRLGTFMSIGGCIISCGPAFAPVVCGSLVTAFGWHSIFWVPLLGMAALFLLGLVFVRNLGTSAAVLDVPSAVLSAVFLFTLSFGLAQLTVAPLVGGVSLAVAAASGAAFVVRQGRCEHPLIDMTPMRSVRFWPAVVLVVIAMTIMFSFSVLLPLYFEGALGMSAFMAGLVILFPVLVNTATTLLSGRIMDRFGEWPLLPCGFALAALGTLGMALVAPGMSAVALFVVALFSYGGIGLVFSTSQTAGLKTLPPQQNPFGVALMTTFLQIAACVGPALFTGILSSGESSALAAGAGAEEAVAAGFSEAILVAAGFAFVGLAVAFVFALAAHRRAQAQAAAVLAASEPVAAAPAPAGEAAAPEAPRPAAALGDARLSDVMDRDPYTIPEGALVRDAMRSLVERRVSGMPVVDAEGRAVGFVSDGDIMRYLADQTPLFTNSYSFIEAANNQTIDDRLRELMVLPVGEVATDKVETLPAATPLKDACQILAKHRFKKVPVVDGMGRVVGVANRSDVLRFAMESYLTGEDAPASGEAPASGDVSRS